MWSKIPQSDQIKCLTLLCIVPTCDFFQHTFQQIFLLALLHLFGSDRVCVGEDGVTELNLLPQSQRRESSFQGDLFKKMIKIDVRFSCNSPFYDALSTRFDLANVSVNDTFIYPSHL